jgi:hypothetical protein
VVPEHPAGTWLDAATAAALEGTGPAEAMQAAKVLAAMAPKVTSDARVKRECIIVFPFDFGLSFCSSNAAIRPRNVQTKRLARRRLPQIEQDSRGGRVPHYQAN